MHQSKNKFLGLQGLRAVAASLVVFQHVTFYVCNAVNIDFRRFLIADFGTIGVSIFFVISGFVIASCFGQRTKFLWNRARRIYPAYWLSILFSFLLLKTSGFDWHFDWMSFLLVPSDNLNNTYLIPYWTLVYEVAFYVVAFGMCLLTTNRKFLLGICIAWSIAIVAVNFYAPVNIWMPGLGIFWSRLNVYFIAGMGLYFFLDEISLISKWWIILAAIGLWLWGNRSNGIFVRELSYLISYSSVVLLSTRLRISTILSRIGDMSFGIYLLHLPIATLTIKLVKMQFPTIRMAPLWLITILIAGLGSALFGWVEYQVHGWLKKSSSNRSLDLLIPQES